MTLGNSPESLANRGQFAQQNSSPGKQLRRNRNQRATLQAITVTSRKTQIGYHAARSPGAPISLIQPLKAIPKAPSSLNDNTLPLLPAGPFNPSCILTIPALASHNPCVPGSNPKITLPRYKLCIPNIFPTRVPGHRKTSAASSSDLRLISSPTGVNAGCFFTSPARFSLSWWADEAVSSWRGRRLF
jgi:hypothetical protein